MVHLEIFDGEQSVCRFCRADFKVVPSFIDCWKEPSISIGEWHKRFATAIVESESRNRLRGEIAHLA